MTIRNGNPGDIVYMNYGFGPQAKILKRKDHTLSRTSKEARGIYYTVIVQEDFNLWRKGDQTDVRAKSLTREKRHRLRSSQQLREE